MTEAGQFQEISCNVLGRKIFSVKQRRSHHRIKPHAKFVNFAGSLRNVRKDWRRSPQSSCGQFPSCRQIVSTTHATD